MGEHEPEWRCKSCGRPNGSRGVPGKPKSTAQCKRQTCGKLFKESGERRDFSGVPSVWKLSNSVDTNPSRASTPHSNAAPRSNTVQNGTRASGYTTIPQTSSTDPMHHTNSKTTDRVKSVNQSITQDISSSGAKEAGGFMGWWAGTSNRQYTFNKLTTPKKG